MVDFLGRAPMRSTTMRSCPAGRCGECGTPGREEKMSPFLDDDVVGLSASITLTTMSPSIWKKSSSPSSMW
jgi:hypothetical protein